MPATSTTSRRSHFQASVQLDVEKSDILKRSGCEIDLTLYELLSVRSPSRKEDKIRGMIIKYLEFLKVPADRYAVDQKGNLTVLMGVGPEANPTIFSCHMDTVHHDEKRQRLVITNGSNGTTGEGFVFAVTMEEQYRYVLSTGEILKDEKALSELLGAQNVKHYNYKVLDKDELEKMVLTANEQEFVRCTPVGMKIASIHGLNYAREECTHKNMRCLSRLEVRGTKRNPSVLGADDRLGIWIMLRMIAKEVPGLYIFHVEEEHGGHGSAYIRDNKADVLKQYKRAIAFDRAYYGDIIGSQRSNNCASGAFMNALAGELNRVLPPFQQFKGNAVGTFTDTANYTKIIPECTNISVGYFDQHSESERFDYVWLTAHLLPAILQVDWNSLPTVRTPKETTYSYPSVHGASTYHRQEQYISGSRVGTTPKLQPRIMVTENDHLKDAYWIQRKNEMPWNVTVETPWTRIPLWDPTHGNYCGKVSDIAMRVILSKWVMLQASNMSVANIILALLKTCDGFARDLAHSKERVSILENAMLSLAEAENTTPAKIQ